MGGVNMPWTIQARALLGSLSLSEQPDVFPACLRRSVQLVGLGLTAAMLAACAQTSVTTNTASLGSTRGYAPAPAHRTAFALTSKRVAVVAGRHRPIVGKTRSAEASNATVGVASFYGHTSQTASGQKFNANELTAAHRTLPFGTRVRVTNIATGHSVVVRINDRGPYVAGRVLDVSHAAAETLHMTDQGVAKVKLDVIQ